MVNNAVYEILWTKRGLKQYENLYRYIKERSLKGSESVKAEVFNKLSLIVSNPKIFEADRFRNNNDKRYRAFTVFHIRFTYRIKGKKIFIVKVIHTSQEPI